MFKLVFSKSSFILFILFALSVNAGVYQWVDEQGKVHFSDKKPESNSFKNIESKRIVSGNNYLGSVKTQQNRLMEKLEETIVQGDPTKKELYFVSFAGDAKQDVFMKESLYAKNLFDS